MEMTQKGNFNLSDKIFGLDSLGEGNVKLLTQDDVKKCIKLEGELITDVVLGKLDITDFTRKRKELVGERLL